MYEYQHSKTRSWYPPQRKREWEMLEADEEPFTRSCWRKKPRRRERTEVLFSSSASKRRST